MHYHTRIHKLEKGCSGDVVFSTCTLRCHNAITNKLWHLLPSLNINSSSELYLHISLYFHLNFYWFVGFRPISMNRFLLICWIAGSTGWNSTRWGAMRPGAALLSGRSWHYGASCGHAAPRVEAGARPIHHLNARSTRPQGWSDLGIRPNTWTDFLAGNQIC